MTASTSAVTLYDHSTNSAPFRALLRTALPLSLPLYSTLSTPGLRTPVWASLTLDAVPENVEDSQPPFVILADLGNQLRFFCSTEAKCNRTDDEVKEAEALVSGALRQYLRDHAGQRDRMSIGAIPDLWRQTVWDTFGVEPFSASEIHYRLLADLPETLTNGSTKGASVLPGGVVTTMGRKEDIAEILSTSEVPHPPSYLATRLAHTTVIRSAPTGTDAATSNSDLTAAPSDPNGSGRIPPDTILAHCTTHRDGSIGTLHVSPLARRRGLGTLVYLARSHTMRDREGAEYVFSYVHKENESSNALMRSVGMDKSGYEVWWARIKLPLPDEEETTT